MIVPLQNSPAHCVDLLLELASRSTWGFRQCGKPEGLCVRSLHLLRGDRIPDFHDSGAIGSIPVFRRDQGTNSRRHNLASGTSAASDHCLRILFTQTLRKRITVNQGRHPILPALFEEVTRCIRNSGQLMYLKWLGLKRLSSGTRSSQELSQQ